MLETGLQNFGVCIMVVKTALGQPEQDLATIAPVAANIMSSFPVLFTCIIYLIWEKCSNRRAVSSLAYILPQKQFCLNKLFAYMVCSFVDHKIQYSCVKKLNIFASKTLIWLVFFCKYYVRISLFCLTINFYV